MKKCPKCGQVYTDKDLNFCFNDGELLSYLAEYAPPTLLKDRPVFADDPPATEFMGSSRVTRETTWPQQNTAAPPVAWQGGQPMDQAQYSQFPTHVAQNQTLAIVSLGLGIGAMTVGWCCSSGLLLSPAALITGFIALSQIKKDPQRFGGRGFAIGGIVTAAVFLALYLLFIIIYGAALFLGG
jgi:hypothetical protein